MDKAEREDAINGIADFMQMGYLAGIREALDRSLNNSKYPEQSAALTERLNAMFPQTPEPEREAAKALPEHLEADDNMPDPVIGFSEMNLYGYTDASMLPLTMPRALELYDSDRPVYLLYTDNSEAMVFERSEIETHDGIFGIERDQWQRTLEYTAMSVVNTEAAKESGLITSSTDMFGIYQLKDAEELRYHRFASIKQLETDNLAVDRANYDLAYTAPLPPKETLDGIYQQFNTDRPKDFTGHSLSPSDVIVIQRGGEVTSHYVDNFGFAELPAFLGDERQQDKAAAGEQTTDKVMSEPVAQRKLSEMVGIGLSKPAEQDDKAAPPLPENKNKPVYKQPLEVAKQDGKLEAWRESRKLNTECAEAIDKSIRANNYELYHYDLKSAVKTVTEEYGAGRVAWVLANTVQKQHYDGRYSSSNQAWAKGFDIPGDSSGSVATHPAIVDGFISRFREAAAERKQPEKPSILAALKQGAQKSKQQPEPGKEPQKLKRMEI
jgi:hypothetical protein